MTDENRGQKSPETIIFIFIDGIGFGKKDIVYNPFTKYGRDFFSALGGKSSFSPPGHLIATDAHMGLYSAAPQSGTGQTALFTGHNTIDIIHRHVAGFPPFSLRPYLKTDSLINKFIIHNLKASVINTYTHKFEELLKKPRSERFMSASTLMQLGSRQKFLNVNDLLQEESIFMDITNWFLRKELGYDVPEISPVEAGRRIVKIARNYNLIIFEYFFPDKYGHEGTDNDVAFIVDHLESFLSGIWEEIDPEHELVVVGSDHGNFEDLSIPTHTHNPIPTIIYGAGEALAEKSIREIYDIPRYIFRLKNISYSEPARISGNGTHV